MNTTRAVTPIIGLVLLIAVVGIAAAAMAVLAADVRASAATDAELNHAETSMQQFAHELAGTAPRTDVGTSVDLAVGDEGAVVTHGDSWLEIAHERPDGTVERERIALGTVEYTVGETTVATEGGAVFTHTQESTRVSSVPSVHYDLPSQTLTLPVADLSTEDDRLHRGTLTLVHEDTRTDVVEGALADTPVRVTVHSEYYTGWERVLAAELGEGSIVDRDSTNRTVTAQIGHLELGTAFDATITHADSYEQHQNANVTGEIRAGTMPALDSVIQAIHEDVRADENTTVLGTITEPTVLHNGTYIADGIDEAGHVAVDLTEGDVTLVVDGDIKASGDTIVVTEWADDHDLTVYVTGDFDASNGGDVYVGDREKDQSARLIQVYGTADMQVDFGPGGDARFEGVLYAAGGNDNWPTRNGCDAQVCVHSNPNLFGAIVAESVEIQASAVEMQHDETLQHASLTLYPDEYDLPPQLTYLNVAHHTIAVTASR